MKIRFRFNTNFPEGKKWRMVFEDNHEIQVDEFSTYGCEVTSDTSEIPEVGKKHHVMIDCEVVQLTMDDKYLLKAHLE